METTEEDQTSEPSLLRDRIAWAPAFLVGFSAAVASELAAGLLLYSSVGFLRALTTVLATEAASLGAGFLFSRGLDPWSPDGSRRRWLFAILTFGAGAVFAGAWGLTAGFATTSLFQGLGLGLLAALPLFSVGAVLGALSAHGDSVAAPASFGAAAGLFVAGVYGIAAVQPASLLLLCVVLLSMAAIYHGWLMDGRLRMRERGDGLEDWARTRPPLRMQVLRVDGEAVDARLEVAGLEAVVVPWQRQVVDAVHSESPGEILLAGVGLGGLADAIRAVAEGSTLTTVGWRSASDETPELSSGVWAGRFDAVIVNTRLLPRRAPLGGPDLGLLEGIVRSWSGSSALFLGGIAGESVPALESTTAWLAERTASEPLYFRPGAGADRGTARSPRVEALLAGHGGLIVCRPGVPGS